MSCKSSPSNDPYKPPSSRSHQEDRNSFLAFARVMKFDEMFVR
jgi:hypothetical protein